MLRTFIFLGGSCSVMARSNRDRVRAASPALISCSVSFPRVYGPTSWADTGADTAPPPGPPEAMLRGGDGRTPQHKVA
jgi:hypothetical protein